MTASALSATARTRTVTATVAFAAAAMLVSYLPFSSVNAILATIGATAGVGTASLQWVTDAFTVALTGAVLSGGALAERYRRRRTTAPAPPPTGGTPARPPPLWPTETSPSRAPGSPAGSPQPLPCTGYGPARPSP